MTETRVRRARRSRLEISRSRGALSGFLLILLGLWGAFIPFVGPYFDFAYTPDSPWTWTLERGWLEVLPGALTAVGGLLLLMSRNRATAMLGGWLAVAAGGWYVVGRALASPLALGNVGSPVAVTEAKRVALELAYFSGLGALVVFLGAAAIGRLSVRSVRDAEIRDADTATTVETTGASHAVEMPDQKTEVIGPTADAHPQRRSWRDTFRRDRKLIHR
ncbi:MAG: hypothetical protein ACSLE3_03380 [Microbacteriaceae bacterium]